MRELLINKLVTLIGKTKIPYSYVFFASVKQLTHVIA
jgi:hypothetical protein